MKVLEWDTSEDKVSDELEVLIPTTLLFPKMFNG